MNVRQRNKTNQKDNSKIKENLTKTNHNITLKVLSRVTIITSLLFIIYYSYKNEKLITVSKQSQVIKEKEQTVDCSSDYINMVGKFKGCFPNSCKRYITDMIISTREAEELLKIAKKVLKLGGSSGGASIFDLHSGALSKEKDFINIYKLVKKDSNILTQNDFNTYRVVKEKIKYTLSQIFEIDPHKVFPTYPTFFSEITSRNAVTLNDEYWYPHIDTETYQAFHYTTLLYLNDYGLDFEGGQFTFTDENVNKTIEPKKGRVNMFTSGAENIHYVEKVTSGVRYALTIPFTCDENHSIDDPSLNKFVD